MRKRHALRRICIDRLAVAAHDAAPRGDASVQHDLHYRALIAMARQPHAIALPVAARIGGLERRRKPDIVGEQFGVTLGEDAAAGDDLRQSLELLSPDRGLNVGHTVIIAEHRVLLEYDLRANHAGPYQERSSRAGAAS